MSDFSGGNDSQCPICKRRFVMDDGVPCTCLQDREEAERETRYYCEVCGVLLEDYEPQMCCRGEDCNCRGLPINPQWCDKCYGEIMGEQCEVEEEEETDCLIHGKIGGVGGDCPRCGGPTHNYNEDATREDR